MHLQKVCIIFALLIVLVLFFMSRSEGFEQKIDFTASTASTTSVPISTLTPTTTQKPTGPVGNSSSLLKVSPGLPPLSPMPIGISAPLQAIPQASQGLTVSQGSVLSNPTGGSLVQGFVAYDLSREEQGEKRER